MQAMVLEKVRGPLVWKTVPDPKPSMSEVLIKVKVCGVCRTDLHIFNGELKAPNLPLILGHQIVGEVVARGRHVPKELQVGARVGVPWLGKSCQTCPYCTAMKENLCDTPVFMGYHRHGGFAQLCVADANFVFPLPDNYSDFAAAPLLCAGLIGYRALQMTEKAPVIGFFGFGSAAHLLCQIAVAQQRKVFAFVRKEDKKAMELATQLGAAWVGDSDATPPEKIDAAIIFAPVGALIPKALHVTKKGGIVVCAGIHMSDIPSFPYSLLWEERRITSVANLTREDGVELLQLAEAIPLDVRTAVYPLQNADRALADLEHAKVQASVVLAVE